MRIARLCIDNFRGIRYARLFFPKHGVLIADNNTGKSTVLEALDLTRGPDRLNRVPPIIEHDFYNGHYCNGPTAVAASCEIGESPKIQIEVVIVDLSLEQRARFGDHIEFWNSAANRFYDMPNPSGVVLMQPASNLRHFAPLADLLCHYYLGKVGDEPAPRSDPCVLLASSFV